jgi:hypothetical protein
LADRLAGVEQVRDAVCPSDPADLPARNRRRAVVFVTGWSRERLATPVAEICDV